MLNTVTEFSIAASVATRWIVCTTIFFASLPARHLGLFHHFVHIGERFGLGFGLHIFDQDILRILAAQAADLLEPDVLLLDFAVDLLFLAVDALQSGLRSWLAQGLLLA